MRPKTDHDRLFKELIKTFFFEFIQLFYPRLAAKLDREAIEFLDKQVFTDVTEGDKHEADLVARVQLSGEEAYFLFHVEAQSSPEVDFPRRMFTYFARLFQTFGMPVYPIAVLSYDAPRTEAPHEFGVTIDGWRVLAFEYRSLQLNRMHWREYIQNDNPVALALAAKMKMDPAERRKVKFECLRLLWTMKLTPARMEMIAGFVNAYLVLAAGDEKWVEEQMAAAAPESTEKKFLFWTSWHDKGYDEGLEKGLEQGLQKGFERAVEAGKERTLRVLERNYRRRFGSALPTGLHAAAARLELDPLDTLSDAVLDFAAPADVDDWLARNGGTTGQ